MKKTYFYFTETRKKYGLLFALRCLLMTIVHQVNRSVVLGNGTIVMLSHEYTFICLQPFQKNFTLVHYQQSSLPKNSYSFVFVNNFFAYDYRLIGISIIYADTDNELGYITYDLMKGFQKTITPDFSELQDVAHLSANLGESFTPVMMYPIVLSAA